MSLAKPLNETEVLSSTLQTKIKLSFTLGVTWAVSWVVGAEKFSVSTQKFFFSKC